MATYPTTAVAYGQTSNDVKTLQNFLISQGINIPAGATGYFGDQTKTALTQWQNSQGITGPGIGTNWGPQSISKAGGSSQSQSQTNNPPVSNTTVTQPAVSSSNPGYYSNILPNGLTQQQVDNQKLMQQYTQQYGGYSINPDGTIAPNQNNGGSTISPTDTSTSSSNSGTIPGLTPGMENLTVSNLPNEAFNGPTSSTQLMPGTPEYQAAMDKLDTSYYDVLQQQMNATTEQEQQAAEYNWQTLKSQSESALGVSLSNNAMQAWTQIQGLKNNANPYFGGRDIDGSGLEAQSIDNYLQTIRMTDAANRSQTQDKETSNQQSYYQQFATPAQVQALVQSNPTLAQSWGLMPSDDVKNQFSAAALKAKYPTMSDNDIQSTIASVLDENGNYRSNLYQKYMTGGNNSIDPGKIGSTMTDQYGNPIVTNVAPGDTGVLDIQAAKNLYQTTNTPYASELADDTARRALGSTPQSTSQETQSNPVGSTQFTNPPSTTTPNSSTLPPSTSAAPTVANPIPTIPGSGSSGTTPPIKTTPVPASNTSQNNPLGSTNNSNNSMYTVKAGDTLSGLYGSNWKTLSGYTGDPTKIQIGSQLPRKGMIGSM